MNIRSIRSRAAWLKAVGVFAFASLLPHDQAHAFAPQDSTHVEKLIPKLPNEESKGVGNCWHYAAVVNDKIYYSVDRANGPIRARALTGELSLEITHKRRVGTNGDYYSEVSSFAVASDGRIYIKDDVNAWAERIAIHAPDGTRIGDFGPAGKGEGSFGKGVDSKMAVSPANGRIYVSDEGTGDRADPAKKGLIRVFDRDGNYLREFRSSGVLAETLEGNIEKMLVRSNSEGKDEVFVVERGGGGRAANWKVFNENGQFIRLLEGATFKDKSWAGGVQGSNAFFWRNLLVYSLSSGGGVVVYPATVRSDSELLSWIPLSGWGYKKLIGFDGGNSLIAYHYNPPTWGAADGLFRHSYGNFWNFDAATRNSPSNPWVMRLTQRPGTGIVDIDYRVDDSNDDTVTTALVGFANGVASLTNVLPLNTLLEGTGSRIGANQPTGTVQRVTWDAGGDWNVDFGTLRVMALARDSRSHWFDTHLVEIPADGARPAVTISRNPLREEDFLVQCFWLVARKDPSVRLVDGVLFGTSGADDGVILANGSTTTPAGKAFLLKRDGLRIATTEEITRAREGATPGFTVQLDPPLQMTRTSPSGTFPNKINEFGIESAPSGTAGTNYWYVVRP